MAADIYGGVNDKPAISPTNRRLPVSASDNGQFGAPNFSRRRRHSNRRDLGCRPDGVYAGRRGGRRVRGPLRLRAQRPLTPSALQQRVTADMAGYEAHPSRSGPLRSAWLPLARRAASAIGRMGGGRDRSTPPATCAGRARSEIAHASRFRNGGAVARWSVLCRPAPARLALVQDAGRASW
jgi:hypothetical protein